MQPNPHPLFSLVYDDVVENCGRTFTLRGKNYQRAGRVLESEWIPEQEVLIGKVAGESALPYTQTVRAEEKFIDGNCSCPVGYNCKHVAALLLTWIDSTADNSQPDTDDSNRASQWRDKLLRVSSVQGHQADNSVFPGEEMLLFQLDPGQQYNSQPGLNVSIVKTRLLKKGGLGKESIYRYQSDYLFPRWMTPIDREIINIALACRDRFNYKPLSIEGNLGIPLLQKLMQSGRCYWKDNRDKPLTIGQSKKLDLDWESVGESGEFSLEAHLESVSSEWHLIPCSEPWYLDVESNETGPIKTGTSGTMLQELLRAPPLSHEQAQETANFFALHMPDEQLPMPTQPSFESISTDPIPVLVLRSLQNSGGIKDYYVSIHFMYDQYQVPFDGSDSVVTEKRNADGSSVAIRRDRPKELDHLVFFNRHCQRFSPASNWDTTQFTSADRMPRPNKDPMVAAEWHTFINNEDVFTNAGWQIQRHDSFDLSFSQANEVSAEVEEDRNGWFDVALTLSSGNQTFELLPLVSEWLEMNDPDRPLMVLTNTGQWAEVPRDVLAPVIRVLEELFDDQDKTGPLRVPRQQADLINEIDADFEKQGIDLNWNGDDAIRTLGENLANIHPLALANSPEGLLADLRDYQKQGLAWLQFLRQYGFNGLLADDMGLGKTLQTLAHLLVEFNEGRLTKPALIIAPTSVLGNWRNEANRFTPSLTSLVLHGSDRHTNFEQIPESQLVITSYQILLRDIELFKEHDFSYLILDEAQMIKNPAAKVTVAAKSLLVPNRLCLTGTPMENHLGELWSLFDFLMPGFLGNRKHFTKVYRTPIEKHRDSDRQNRLNKKISIFLLRRNKEQVASELPPKTEIIREIELGPKQVKLYESIRLSMEQRVRELISQKGMNRSHIEILDALLKLRQTCCHPQLVKLDSAREVTESAKTEMLLDMIEELIAEDKKILLFSQFTQMLDLIAKELDKLSIPYVMLTGKTRKREEVIDSFQNGDIPLFLISLKAGGTGLNLTAADTVIHYDPWWNPAVENQASDRAHRIGQEKPVFVYKLVTKNSVEEKIMLLQHKKQRLADATYNRDETADPLQRISHEDLLDLFN